MSRTTSSRPSRLTRDAQRLVTLSQSLALSGSRLEDAYWENLLGAQLLKLLQGKKNRTVESALDHLVPEHINAYEILIEHAETCSESAALTHLDQEYDVLLFSAPIVAWTRYQLGHDYSLGKSQPVLLELLKEHIGAENTRIAILSELVSFDQMPHSFQETLEWTRRLGRMALTGKEDSPTIKPVAHPEGMLADARFIVGAIVTPKHQPVFRWQTAADQSPTRADALAHWSGAASEHLAPLFAGCTVEYLQPDAFYTNSREADHRIRPLALKAAVTWLQTAAGMAGGNLRATIVGCGESLIEEYRIGFSTRQSPDVIYGCIWPILSKEEAIADAMENDEVDTPEEIAALLNELSITDVRRLPGLYATDFCDDCGAPYFPNPMGEMQHPELPEEIDINPLNFH